MKKNTVSIIRINKYGSQAVPVLENALYIEQLPKKGKAMRAFKELKPLPSQEEFNQLRNKRFTYPLSSLIEDSISEIHSLRDEMQEWQDKLEENEGLSQTSKHDEVADCVSELEQIDDVTIPPEVEELGIEVICIPAEKLNSRDDRMSDSKDALQACIEVLQEWLEKEEAIEDEKEREKNSSVRSSVEDLIGELESVVSIEPSFPGMY